MPEAEWVQEEHDNVHADSGVRSVSLLVGLAQFADDCLAGSNRSVAHRRLILELCHEISERQADFVVSSIENDTAGLGLAVAQHPQKGIVGRSAYATRSTGIGLCDGEIVLPLDTHLGYIF